MPIVNIPGSGTPRKHDPKTLAEAIPIINGTVSTNEAHHPGWTNKARELVMNFAHAFGKPFDVNDLAETPEKHALDQITKTKSGIGGVIKTLGLEGKLIKLEQQTHDSNGNVLRRDVGLWATPDVAAQYNPKIVVRSKVVSKIIDLWKKCSAAERDLLLEEFASIEGGSQ